MKRLTLLRHAESNWNHPGLTDFERPLNERGRRESAEIGARLAKRNFEPELILTSPAQRATETLAIIAPAIDYNLTSIVPDKTLYGASLTEMYNLMEKLDDSLEHILMVGHDPTWTELANHLLTGAGPSLHNIPPCGVVDLELKIQTWNEIHENCAHLLHLDTPD